MIKFNEERVEKIKSDYSIFYPSIKQMEIIYDIAKHGRQYFQIDEATLRLILIKAITQTQIENENFHYLGENDPPSKRLLDSYTDKEHVTQYLYDLLQDPEDMPFVQEKIDLLFKYYKQEYAIR